MRRVAMLLGVLVVMAVVGPSVARAESAPPTLADKVECRFATGLPKFVPFEPSIKLARNSTECVTTVYTLLDPKPFQYQGQTCVDYVGYPTIRWYHGNRLRDGVLREGVKPYAVLHDTSVLHPVCS